MLHRVGLRPCAGAAVAATVLLGACATQHAGRPAPPVTGPPAVASPGPGSAGDGPPEVPPADLDALPDAQPRIEPIRPGGPNKPYAVRGQRYEPQAADLPLRERGQASWYGRTFHGRRTASGEVFNMYAMTAAHRTWPIPSYARVRNPANGREVIVRVNDRGPFHPDRVLDLSYAAAYRLGTVARGTATVEFERLTFEDIRSGAWMRGAADPIERATAQEEALSPGGVSGPPAARSPQPDARPEAAAISPDEIRAVAHTRPARGFWVQIGAFGQRSGAESFQQQVSTRLAHLAPLLAVFNESARYRLQVGPYQSRTEAQSVAAHLRDALALVPLIVERR